MQPLVVEASGPRLPSSNSHNGDKEVFWNLQQTQLSFRHLIFSPDIMDHLLNIVDQGIKLVVIEVQNAFLIDVSISLTVITVALFPILIIIPAPCLLGIGDPFPPFHRPFLSVLIPTSVI